MFHAKSLRRIEVLRWSDFVSNEKLLQLTKQSWFSTQAAERTIQWFGHLLRMPPTSTRKDDLLLRPYQSWLEATSRPTEETLVRLPVRVLDDCKHQTGRRANTRHGPRWMEEADVTFYAEQCPAGDLSQSKSYSYNTYN